MTPPPPRRRSPPPALPPRLLLNDACTLMKWKISTQVILRRGEGFYEQELLYFVVFFESADLLAGRAKHLGR